MVRHLSAKQGLSQEANAFNSRTLRHAEGTAEWPATGPENQGIREANEKICPRGNTVRAVVACFVTRRGPSQGNGPNDALPLGMRVAVKASASL